MRKEGDWGVRGDGGTRLGHSAAGDPSPLTLVIPVPLYTFIRSW